MAGDHIERPAHDDAHGYSQIFGNDAERDKDTA
jgi:hypothetical protein